jgi:hypothetical protein
METKAMTSIVRMERELLSQLTSEVKETIALNFHPRQEPCEKRIFTSAELWNIQRKSRFSNYYIK